ncbi:MAG: lytic transglycosylase domain-containing protein [Acidobacteria bacterium]|nr:MAG: lytic transglycosylase domain-containing protein [Acidobacteriota bacterium]
MRTGSLGKSLGLIAVIGGILSISAWVTYLTWPRKLDISVQPVLPIIKVEGGALAVQLRTDALLAKVGDYSSELEAYLHFEYLKAHAGLDGSRVLLTVKNAGAGPHYQIFLVLDNDLLSDVPYLGGLKAKGYIPDFELYPISFEGLARRRLETAVFLGSYNPTGALPLSDVPPTRLLEPLASFLVFKSMTDRRVRENIQPVPTTLSNDQAKELAADTLDVVHFYGLPLEVFLGIGAMENNYMNVRGDLDHAVWKRRPQRGDIVLRRTQSRVLVSDYAMGVWQITRETLRRAHELYLGDKRDYSALPPRLRPSKQLSFDLDNSEVLTTYAGLLLRHLLDKSDGDIAKAVGAYNGSFEKPNYQYAAGVEAVALYARDFLERAAHLDGMNVAKSWLARPALPERAQKAATGTPSPSRQGSGPDSQ